MINIVTSFYISKTNSPLDSVRSEELLNCLIKNMESEIVEKIYLYVDDELSYEKVMSLSHMSQFHKIHVIAILNRPKHKDFFKFAIEELKGKICMITNSDIYIHEYNYDLINKLNNEKIAYSLTRYEHDMSCPLINHYQGSHDSYIFRSDMNISVIDNLNYYPNTPGIENWINRELFDQGYKLFNPCYQIKIVHLHRSELSNHEPHIHLFRYNDDVSLYNSSSGVKPCII